ncbi:hypothetical protein M5E87_26255 [Flavonifractor plautii]|nr:hypothetical protein M5E87_26255 [Flavonifractor plautii]
MLPELALDEFFPLYKDTRYFAYAEELDGPTVRRFRSLAGSWGSTWPFRCLKRV